MIYAVVDTNVFVSSFITKNSESPTKKVVQIIEYYSKVAHLLFLRKQPAKQKGIKIVCLRKLLLQPQ